MMSNKYVKQTIGRKTKMKTCEVYHGYKCDRCGRRHGINTVLNIEGHIHHNIGFVCMDNKSCKRAKRKRSK